MAPGDTEGVIENVLENALEITPDDVGEYQPLRGAPGDVPGDT